MSLSLNNVYLAQIPNDLILFLVRANEKNSLTIGPIALKGSLEVTVNQIF